MAAAAGQPAPAALDEHMLNQIFNGLPEREPSDNQSESRPFLELYLRFARSGVGLSAASVAALDALAHGREATTDDGDTRVSCDFFPQYGSVLVFFAALGCAAEPTTRLKLLGLDGWTWDGISGGHFAATAGAPTELDAGSVSASELARFRKRLNKLMDDVRKRTGDARSAANSKQGHQRTPAMILCLVEQAIAGDGRERQPRGGLTDVGLHTGGRQRATAWPLAAAVIRLVVEQLDASSNQPTYESLLPLWELWLAEQALDAAAAGKRIVDVGDIASMLHSSVCRAVPRSLDGHAMPADFEKRVVAVRTGVEKLQRAEMKSAADAYVLPPLVCEGDSIDGQQPSLPVLHIPPPPDAQFEATDVANARARAFKNLDWLPLPPGIASSASEMAEWLRLQRIAPAAGAPRMSSHLRAEATECWIFNAAVTLLPDESVAESASQVMGAMQSLVAVLKAYRDGIEHALAADAGGRLLTELRSRETLACWTVACLADRLACVAFPLLRKYHMALNFADLRHLSLSDGLALDALHAVCAYLRTRTRTDEGNILRPLFSLLPRDKTIEFATQVASELDHTKEAWKVEQRHAAGRRDAHWVEVQKKQALALTLRTQLETAEGAVADAKLNFDKAPHGAVGSSASECERAAHSARLELQAKLMACRAIENDLKQKLAAALKAPSLVMQPLPSDPKLAHAVLFFLYMPTVLRMLSQLSFEAQAALMPRPLRPDECKADGCDKMTWDWQRKHADLQDCEFYKFSPAVRETSMGTVELKSKIELPKAQEQPKTVDDMSSSEHGVWHPDAELFLHWKGLDPWKPVSRKCVRAFYTPQLPECWSSEQWALPADDCGATTSERGNMAVAAQADRPDWLSKSQYLAFAGVRAFGHAQLRKLACALHDRSLPLSHEAAQVLLRGAMHQLGPLRALPGDAHTFMPWKADLTQGPLLNTLHHELMGLADELADRISEHGSLLALLDVLAYLRAWEPASDRLRALRARCTDIARGWNKATEEQLPSGIDPAAVPSLRARQCVFAMYGILAHAGSDVLSDDEAASLLCFAVMAHDGYVYQADASPPDGPETFAALRSRCEAVMAAREETLVAVARADGGSALTAALQCVHEQAPPQLAWTELAASGTGNMTGCFEAATPDGHLYSMNALTGLVLLDGSPPRSLPADLLKHPLYKRTFGDRDFEVFVTDAGALRTVRPLAGWVYEFFMHRDGKLFVKELPPQKSEDAASELELMDGTPDGIAEWGAELPIRLRELHSHWLCRASNALFVRDTCLPLRRVAFVGLLGDAPTAMDDACTNAAVRCFRVPLHLGDRPASELAALAAQGEQLCDVLQLWPTGAPVSALSKFEEEALMHWYRNESSGIFSVELPRYRLEFTLKPGSGTLASKDYNQYDLAHCQQLSDALPGLSQYLLLEPAASLLAQPPWDAPPLKMIVPAGTVERDDDGCVHVVGDDAPGAARGTWTFDEHRRFGELRAHSVAARLHLAALHAACDTGVPEPRTGLTGAELALEDVRRSFINRPPSAEEQDRCDNVAALARATPALHLACAHWSDSARQVAFLYPEVEIPPRSAGVHNVADSSMAYKHYVLSSGSCAKLRLKLTPAEERRMLGTLTGAPPEERDRIALVQEPVVHLPKPPVDASYVAKAEARLSALVTSSKTKKALPFPLAVAADAMATDALGKDMHEELRASWAAKQRLELHTLSSEPRALLKRMQTELAAATAERVAAQAYLMDAATAEPGAEASEPLRRAAAAVRLRRASGALPPPSLPQLALVPLDQDAALPAISPLLAEASAADKSRFVNTTLTWMQLCVLEDKLTRLTRMAAAAVAVDGDADASASVCADIVRELRNTRKWDAAEHPEWLAFELDGALQIRPAQHALAKAVLAHANREATKADEPGPILQLNMGEGKTRVIVPMLVLHWARQRKHVRLNTLSQLLSEAYDHLHAHLTGGLLATQLFLLPFHRDVQVTPQRVAVLLAHAQYACSQGGAVLVTPESRLSMHLKQHELRAAAAGSSADAHNAAADTLERIEKLPWHDIIDESDAMLRVKLQLVYAVGSPGALPYLQQRVAALAALLRALRDDPTASELLADERIAVRLPGPPGAFLASLRLLPGSALDDALPRLHKALAAAVLSDPPHELRWLLHARYTGDNRETVLAYVTDTSLAADDIIAPEDFGSTEHHAALLALRGFLAHGVLAHALRQRHRVDYGVAPPGPGRRKRLAVPFRACDVPALRAEFAHPDAALALTTVSYYYSGLSDAEVLDAFTTLLTLGETEQAARYDEWHAASAPGMVPAEAASVDGVRKLDLSNVLQRALLCKTYARCVPLIDFWLQARVLPSETTQYPQRLRATAWDMRCDNAKAAAGGFSGTNDKHRLLPLHVRQQPLPDAALQATDGHMLVMLLDKARYQALPAPAAGELAWQALLRFAVVSGTVALVDAGALLAGVELAGAAKYTLELLRSAGSDLAAVAYFDAASGHAGEWVLADHQGGLWPKQRAPVTERDAFVIFDEARCRGADMRLRRDARALLTLGPCMGKDKLMQAAGRLRQLDRGQSLLLTAQRDVHDAILVAAGGESADVTVQAVLTWVVANTVAASRAGLLEWSVNGLHYAAMQSDPAKALGDEKLSLDAFYAAAATPQDVGDLVEAHAAARKAADGALATPVLTLYVKEVVDAAAKYGRGTLIAASTLDEECERELEQEEEQEQEIEMEGPRRAPRAETDWNVAAAAALQDADAGAMRLADAVANHLRPAELAKIAWSSDVWVTANFMRTLAPPDGASADDEHDDLSLYQRPVDAMLRLPDGGVLLLSDREAETLLEAHWAAGKAAGCPPLLHYSYACNARDASLMAPDDDDAALSDEQAAALQLFNGETTLGGEDRVAAATAMLRSAEARGAALHLPVLRGNAHLLARSHLEACCEAEDAEEREPPSAKKRKRTPEARSAGARAASPSTLAGRTARLRITPPDAGGGSTLG